MTYVIRVYLIVVPLRILLVFIVSTLEKTKTLQEENPDVELECVPQGVLAVSLKGCFAYLAGPPRFAFFDFLVPSSKGPGTLWVK